MYLKTTSPQFLKYGRVLDESTPYKKEKHHLEDKTLGYLYKFPCDVKVSILEGIGIVVVQTEDGSLEQFVIHRSPVINAGVPFKIISITNAIVVEQTLLTDDPVKVTEVFVPGDLSYEAINSSFDVTNIYSYYYNVKGKGYHFDGESHEFWELTYVDTGELIVEVEGEEFKVESQEIMIFFPGQFHKQHIDGNNSSSYLTIMFDMNLQPDKIEHIKNTVIECNNNVYNLMNKFIQETTQFEAHTTKFSKDLVILTLKEILVNLAQVDHHESSRQEIINPIQSKFENELLNEINNYIHNNIYEPLTVEDICAHFSISRSTLQSLFKKHVNIPPKRYVNDLKMAQAQRLILEGKYSITEVSLNLGFSSIHYFSRKFKASFGMAPTEYLQSVYKLSPEDKR